MTKSYYVIIFICIMLLLFSVNSRNVDFSTQYGLESHEYSQNLIRACQDAVSVNSASKELCIYDTEEKRDRAAYIFYKTLSDGFNMTYDANKQDALRFHVPALLFIDYDGFYVVYNAIHTGDDGKQVSQTITPINIWAAQSENQNYAVRFFLSNEVEVTKNSTGEIKRGNYKQVYDYFQDPVGLSLIDNDHFEETKYAVITRTIENTTEYYINQYNFAVNRISDGIRTDYDVHYTFTLPEVSNEDWCGLLCQPSCMAFLQGPHLENEDNYINIYSMARGKLLEDKNYYIAKVDGEFYYHRAECIYTDRKSKAYDSRQACARIGAYPCSECNP